jgi:di/tricarboxylate transporter
VQISLSISLAASLSMALPASTPPNATACASGEFAPAGFVRAGSLLSGLALVPLVAVGGPLIASWTG